MSKQTDEVIDHLVPHLYNVAVQNRRCWALLNHIIQKEIVINAPTVTKPQANGKSQAPLTELRTSRKW
jgi:hypothetical protein